MASWKRQAELKRQERQSQRCKCGQGYHSLIDLKCSHCRTKSEQQAWLNRPSRELKISIVNKHHGHPGEYIGRGSPLGNPFPINNATGQTREVVIQHYREWLDRQIQWNVPVVIDELQRLGDLALSRPLALQCFCCPAACHGDVIKRVLFDAISKTYPDTHWWMQQ